MAERILRLTEPLRKSLRISWATYEKLWQCICADKELLKKLTEVSPRGNPWELNMKLVLNVIGMLKATPLTAESNIIDDTTRALANSLGVSNKRSYIDNPRPDGRGSHSALTPPLYARVERLISTTCASR